MKLKNSILLIVFSMLAISICAQDPHFSQFFASPLTLNPAFAGKFDGNIRATGNYRNQWSIINKAFVTSTISVDFPLLQKSISSNDILGAGIMNYSDKGANGAVNFNYLSGVIAYHKGLDEDGFHQLGIGIQSTYANMSIDISALYFEDQLDIFGGWTLPLNDPVAGNESSLKSNYFDISSGILYTGSTNEKNSFYLGVSGYHLNKPNESFVGGTHTVNQRITIHTGGSVDVGQSTKAYFSALVNRQGNARETMLGGAMEITPGTGVKDYLSVVYTGLWFRFGDALIPYLGLEYNHIRLGVSYDINVSSLKTGSQGKGGLELSLQYIYRRNNERGVKCPKF